MLDVRFRLVPHCRTSEAASGNTNYGKSMRTANPDLHFQITEMIDDGEWFSVHSVMTGSNTGELRRPRMLPTQAPPALPATGRSIRIAHKHMIRFQHGRNAELLLLMDTMAMAGQLRLAAGWRLDPESQLMQRVPAADGMEQDEVSVERRVVTETHLDSDPSLEGAAQHGHVWQRWTMARSFNYR